MRHSIPLYDTGKKDWLNRRNEGWAFASIFGGVVGLVFVLVFGIAAASDPTMGGMTPIFWVMGTVILTNFLMFATHRNFMLEETQTKVMDAYYSLSEEDRKRWSLSRNEILALDGAEASEFIKEIKEYRRNRVVGGSVSNMLGEMREYNKVVKEIGS